MSNIFRQILLLTILCTSNFAITQEENLEKETTLNLLKTGRRNCLEQKKIIITCEKAPNEDVPSFGFGDAFMYCIVLYDYLERYARAEVMLCPPKPLIKFFKTCSDLSVFEEKDKKQDFIKIECKDLLKAIPNIHTFECKRRYLSKNCVWANQEARKVLAHIKKMNIIPILFTRQSSKLPKELENNPAFNYLDRRSITREELSNFLQTHNQNLETVKIFNIQFEDQKEPDIYGTEKPIKLYPGYSKKNGAFINDAILMKAVIQAGGYIVSVETAAGHVGMFIPEIDNTRKNVIFLLAKKHSCRWKPPFLKNNNTITWAKNVTLLIQENYGDWMPVLQKLVAHWYSIVKKNK
ncbi:hypothetical protein ACFLYU_01110 [Candidatus Dependentiae bacterium]